MANIKDCRLLVSVDGTTRKICRLLFPTSDASLYLIPYGKTECYTWGQGHFHKGQEMGTFDPAPEAPGFVKVKLSIHESGQVHVKTQPGDEYKAGPLQGSPLWQYRGEHLATVTIDNLQALPAGGKSKAKPHSPDVLLKTTDSSKSRRFVLYANGESSDFDVPTHAKVTMNRAGLPAPLHLGITVYEQNGLVEPPEGGLTIIAGWKRASGVSLAEEDFLWVRAL